ncbi:MAG TPA: hypothetical protein VFY87_10765, partial [Geminicoccaceae bacterium]|nr:hypothetical protein [Geminicoccaceae bacterium]
MLALIASFAPACSWRGPPLAGFEGLENEVVGFYRANATERQMSCTMVTMTPVAAEVVEDAPRRVVIEVRNRWTANRARRGRGFGPGFCNGWGQRTFTLARANGGAPRLVGMTGEQRGWRVAPLRPRRPGGGAGRGRGAGAAERRSRPAPRGSRAHDGQRPMTRAVIPSGEPASCRPILPPCQVALVARGRPTVLDLAPLKGAPREKLIPLRELIAVGDVEDLGP